MTRPAVSERRAMSEAKALAAARGPWRDPLAELEVVTSRDGVEYYLWRWTTDLDLGLAFGVYCGFPRCCVQAFCDDEFSPRGFHPVSGHRLCAYCNSGTMAPLPARPAERYGFILPPFEDFDVYVIEPSPRPEIEIRGGFPAFVSSVA